MAFDQISSAESIATLVTAITALIGGIATFIYKVRGKSWREIVDSLMSKNSKDVEELSNVVKTQSAVIKDVIEKAIKSGQDNKGEKKSS